MKGNLKILIGVLLVVTTAITACGKKSKGSQAAPPGAGADGGAQPPPGGGGGACTVNQQGGCDGGTAYQGQGQWYGQYITVTDMNKYKELMQFSNLCGFQQCNNLTNILNLQIYLAGGFYGNQAQFMMRSFFGGFVNGSVYKWRVGQAYKNADDNGFQIVHMMQQFNWWGMPQQQQGEPNVIQVVTTNGQYQGVLKASLFFRGVKFAEGDVYMFGNMGGF